jgi:hypothetical protein
MLVIDKIDVTIEGLLPKECGTYGDSQLTKQISDIDYQCGACQRAILPFELAVEESRNSNVGHSTKVWVTMLLGV